MFKLYNDFSALGRFSQGCCTEFIDNISSMQGFEVPEGYAFTCPEKDDYWMGSGVALFKAPKDEGSKPLTQLWDQYIAPLMPNAAKKLVFWESSTIINYKNFKKNADLACEVILKHSPQKTAISRPSFNIKKITTEDFTQMVDIYVTDAGEAQREFTEWRTTHRMADIQAGDCNFFSIWNVDKNQIVAIAGLYQQNGIFRYASVTTRKAYRGRGYATALIAHIRDYALEQNAKEIYILASHGSQAAGIYMNAGFEVNGYIYSILADRQS